MTISLSINFTAIFFLFFSCMQAMEKSSSFPQDIQKSESFLNKAKRSNSESIIVTKRSDIEYYKPVRVCDKQITLEEVKDFQIRRKIVQNKIIEEAK